MTKIQSVLNRFLKGAIAGAISSVLMVGLTQPTQWSELSAMLNSLALAASYGAVTGILLALQKYATWVEKK